MSTSIITDLKNELSIMDGIIYKHNNQHRHGKYFQKLKMVRNKIKYVVNNYNNNNNIKIKDIEYIEQLAVSTAEIYTILLGRSYFMPLALVCISLMAKVISLLNNLKVYILKNQDEKQPSSSTTNNNNNNNVIINTDNQAEKYDEKQSINTINTMPMKTNNMLETSLDSLLDNNYNSNDTIDDHEYNNKKRKKKKKKKKKNKKMKIEKEIGGDNTNNNNDDGGDERDAIDDIFGF